MPSFPYLISNRRSVDCWVEQWDATGACDPSTPSGSTNRRTAPYRRVTLVRPAHCHQSKALLVSRTIRAV
jgi:hypothetical protein